MKDKSTKSLTDRLPKLTPQGSQPKVPKDVVPVARSLADGGFSQAFLAEQFGLSQSTLHRVVRKKGAYRE